MSFSSSYAISHANGSVISALEGLACKLCLNISNCGEEEPFHHSPSRMPYKGFLLVHLHNKQDTKEKMLRGVIPNRNHNRLLQEKGVSKYQKQNHQLVVAVPFALYFDELHHNKRN